MTINSFKKLLLAGTAIVAVAAFSTQAHALPRVMTASGTWASSGVPNAATALIADAVTGDAVDITTGAATLTITNNNTATDGGGVLIFNIGAITDSGAGVGTIAVVAGASAGVEAVTIASAVVDGAFSAAYADATISTGQTIAVTGAMTVGTTFSLVNSEATAAETQAMTVGGALTVTGASTITGGARIAGGTTTALTVTGNSTFTGAVTVTGGAGHATTNTATLTLNGATNAFTGGLTLADGAAGSDAILTLAGTAAQTVSGTIAGGAVGKINVNNALGATFSGTVAGAVITIDKTAAASSATFQNTVNATTITLGATDTGTNTLTLDGTTQAFTVTGTVDGTATAAEVNNVVVSGGRTITTATAWGGVNGNLDSVAVSGTSTILSAGASMTATAFTVGTGATLQTSGAATLTGTINGAGTLDVNANTTVTGVIGGTTALTLVDIAAGTTLTLGAGATYAATTTTMSGVGTGILSLNASAHALTTNVTTATNGAGAFNVLDNASTSSITGNIGTSALKLATMDIADGGTLANVFTTTGNLYVNAITLGATDTISFIGTGTQTVSGTVTGTTASTLSIGAASNVAFGGAVTSGIDFLAAGAAASLADGAALVGDVNGTGGVVGTGIGAMTFGGTHAHTGAIGNTGILSSLTITDAAAQKTVTTSGAILAADTINLNDNVLSAGTTFGLGAAQTLNATIVDDTSAATYGHVISAGAATVAATSLLNLTVSSTNYIATGAQFIIVDGVGGAAVTALAAGKLTVNGVNSLAGLTVTNGLMTYSQVVDTANLTILATRAGIAATTTNTNNDNAGTVLDTAYFTTGAGNTGNISLIQGNIQNAATAAALDLVLEATLPTVDGGAEITTLDMGITTQGLAETRIASIRSGSESTGMAAGVSANGGSMWLQGYGQTANQDTHNGVKGYDADTLGGAIGGDSTNLIENAVIGLSLNYGRTNVDSNNANTTATDVDNYGVNLYSSFDLGEMMFLNGQAGYAYNNIDTDRHNVGGIAGVTANGDTHSNQYSAKLALGRDYDVDYGMTVTPSVSAAYTFLDTAGYTETGAGAANLVVDNTNRNILDLGVGINTAWKLKNSDGSMLKPAIHVGYAYDAIGDDIETTSTFNGVGTAFTTSNSPSRSRVNAGLGVTYMTTSNWDVSANYDYTYKQDFNAHSGVVRATAHF